MSQKLKRNVLIRLMDRVVDVFIALNILAVTILVFAQVIMRYVLRMPLMGIEELCYFPTTWLYLGGAVKASSLKSQLVARVLEIFIKKQKLIYLLRAFAALITCGILCWLVYWGYDLLKYSFKMKKLTDTLFIPWCYAEGMVFVSITLMLFYTVVECFEYFREWTHTSFEQEKITEEVVV